MEEFETPMPLAADVIETDGFAPWDGRRVPVTLLGGYLGAGKTTMLNAVLARTDRPIAVVVNDVGSINVDAALVARRSGDVLELTDGCVCCSLAGGLRAALAMVRERAQAPDHVVVELSGVADPSRLLSSAYSDGFRLDGVVVLVDVDHIDEQLANPVINPIVRRQIETADLLLLSKVSHDSAAPAAATRQILDEIAPATPVLSTTDAAEGAAIIELGARRPGGHAATPPPQLFDPHVTSTLPMPSPTSQDQIESMLDALPGDVVRAKGIAATATGERLLIQVVGRRRMITRLPQAEQQPPTDLVVIAAPLRL